MVSLQIIWYLVIVLSLVCYSMLDGFDLGVGAMHLFARKDEHRRIFLNAIGPVWDGNEVWLVIVGGALFAGFPDVYATVFSVFYVPTMILLAGLIFRAAAIEFRSKNESRTWRSIWDGVFCISSIVVGFTCGVMLANLVQGIPLNENMEFVGSISEFFNTYTISIGITVVALFSMHGAVYLLMKTEGELHSALRKWVLPTMIFFGACYLEITILTFKNHPHMIERIISNPLLIIIPLLALLAIINIPLQIKRKNDGWAFLSSCLSIALLLTLFGLGTFPIMVRSTINPAELSLTLYNSSSSALTLKLLLFIVIIGVPLVLAYGYYIYHIFRGKVKIDKHSY